MGKDDRRHIGRGEILFQPIDIAFQEREALVPVVLHARLPEHQMKAVHIDALTGERGTQQFLALRAAHKFLIVVANDMPARSTDTLERTGDICGQFPVRVIILVADSIAKVDD